MPHRKPLSLSSVDMTLLTFLGDLNQGDELLLGIDRIHLLDTLKARSDLDVNLS